MHLMPMPNRRSLLRRLFAPVIGRRRGFARDEDGAVAIEFAVLALPFFALIFAILETSLVFFAGQILDSAVQDASRKVRTGQAQTFDLAAFRGEICKGLYGLFDCTKLRIKVSAVSDYQSATVTNPIKPGCQSTGDPTECDWALAESFVAGAKNSIMLVQAYYKWPVMLNLPGFNFASQAGGTRLLAAVRVFSNEPF
jgi:Flp pilus assembly protein TadG